MPTKLKRAKIFEFGKICQRPGAFNLQRARHKTGVAIVAGMAIMSLFFF
jgi:hypothetical protein